MTIQLANALFDEGIFSELYKAGFITDKVFLYREIYLWVQARQQTRKISTNQAVSEAEIQFNRDRRTIWRALQAFSAVSNATDKTVSPKLSKKLLIFEVC